MLPVSRNGSMMQPAVKMEAAGLISMERRGFSFFLLASSQLCVSEEVLVLTELLCSAEHKGGFPSDSRWTSSCFDDEDKQRSVKRG